MVEAATDAGDAADASRGVCSPQPFSGAPTWVPPTPLYQGVCTDAQLDSFVAACVGDTDDACASFRAANATCAVCTSSFETDTAWGPVVVDTAESYSRLNRAGCVANLIGDTSSTGCGAAEGRVTDCARRACFGCLPIERPADSERFAACEQTAFASEICKDTRNAYAKKCDRYYDTADPTSPGTFCRANFTLEKYLRLWCGSRPDAGADGGDAGDGG